MRGIRLATAATIVAAVGDLLVHGARAVVRISEGRTDARSQWVNDLVAHSDTNRAIAAVANKNARIIWSFLANGGDYQPPLAA